MFLFLDRYKKKDGDDFTQIRIGRVTRKTSKLNIIVNISISVMNGFLVANFIHVLYDTFNGVYMYIYIYFKLAKTVFEFN